MIIISLTSSWGPYLARLVGFLFLPNRLNVAISRARTKVVIFGAKNITSAFDNMENDEEPLDSHRGLEVLRRILSLAHVHSVGLKPPIVELPKEVLPSRQPKRGFEIGCMVTHKQYGIGRVLSKAMESIDNKRQWVLQIRFNDGRVRMIIPSLCNPPLQKN